MKHKLLKILSFLLIIAIIIASCLFYAIYISPDKLTIRYDAFSSKKIPTSLDDVNIGFFSDVYYMSFMDRDRFDRMLDQIKSTDIDILIFGGDLFANPTDPNITAEVISEMTQKLSELDAPLGKFYVLGEIDNSTPDTRTLISNILYNAGFEDMTNHSFKIHNGKLESITLIGLDNCINGSVDVQSAFNGTSTDSYTILVSHTPDNINVVGDGSIDVMLAGHSFGGQIYLPILGTMNKIEGATNYYHGTYTLNNKTLIVSNGLGTKEMDMRLFCPPQFNIIRLNHRN